MSSSLDIQVTREVCTVVSQASESGTSTAAQMTGTAMAFPPQAHTRRVSIPSSPPPAYQGAPALSTVDDDDNNGSFATLPPPPDYTKFTESSRAERCFYYGFLFCPIWIYGLLHFWTIFSSTPRTMPLKETELPQWIDPTTGLPMYSTPTPSSVPTSPSQKTFSWRRSTSSNSSRQSACTVLMMNRPDVYSVWKKEERKWALRSGYAMTVSWGLLLMFLFICIQTGVFGVAFS